MIKTFPRMTLANPSAPDGDDGGGASGGVHDDVQKRRGGIESNDLIESGGENDVRAKVMIVYVGGTMGMTEDEFGSLKPKKGYLTETLKKMPELKESDMPEVTMKEYETLVDSSDMDSSDWVKIAKDIEENYLYFDGFVILQGTDTMAYTSSALGFMLENLAKPVVLTGSMIPLAKGYSDARRNLLISVYIAGTSRIPEVCVFFHDKLMRGVRVKKLHTEALDAFHAPNYPPLADCGVSIEYHERRHRMPPRKPFRIHTKMETGIIALRMIPGFNDDYLIHLGQSTSLKALIIELYGTGNAPSRKMEFVQALKRIVESGKLVAVVSQCPSGHVMLSAYAVGRSLQQIGCISAGDMTLEAVATKLSYLYGRGLSSSQVARALRVDLRGEITVKQLHAAL